MIRNEITPLEEQFHAEISVGDRWEHTLRQTEILEGLKASARAKGLWNFWLTDSKQGFGLTTVEYAYLAEEMGKSLWRLKYSTALRQTQAIWRF